MEIVAGRMFGNLLPKLRDDTLVLKERLEKCLCINNDILNTCKQCRLDSMEYLRNNFTPKDFSRSKKTFNCFTGTDLHHYGLVDRLMEEIERGVAEEDIKKDRYEEKTSDMEMEDEKENILRNDIKLLYRKESGGINATLLVHRLMHRNGIGLSTETLLTGLVLLERLKKKRADKGGLALCTSNMRSIILGVMMIASKIQDVAPYDLKWWRAMHYMDLNKRGIRFTELLLLRLFEWEVVVYPYQISEYLFERGITMPFMACFQGMSTVTGIWHDLEEFQKKRFLVEKENILTFSPEGQILVSFLELTNFCTLIFLWY